MDDYSLSPPRSSYLLWIASAFLSHKVPNTLFRGHICSMPSCSRFSHAPLGCRFHLGCLPVPDKTTIGGHAAVLDYHKASHCALRPHPHLL